MLLGLVALWFCVRNAVHGLVEREYPALGLAIVPSSPVSQAVIALNRAAARDGVADVRTRELYTAALRRAPLSGEPFIVAGLDASAHDDFARARRLMEEARRRDPRSVVPRYWLFDYYIRYGMFREGVAEAQPLIRLQPAASAATAAVLTALLEIPSGRAALLEELRKRPIWRRAFFNQVAASPRLRRQGASLLRLTTPEGGTGWMREHLVVMRALIRDGDHAEAYDLWLRTLPVGSRPNAPGLHDGYFTGRPGGPPFGWRFPEARRGTVQPIETGDAAAPTGLAIRSEGDTAATLAEQTVLAAPGPHRLRFSARALEDAAVGDARLRAEVRCAADNTILARREVNSLATDLAAYSLDFILGPGCRAALVRLSVAPGIEPGPLNALVTAVSLSRR